jgi:hypothetical protein
MASVISKVNFGSIKVGDTIATFKMGCLADCHYWVQRGWAEVKYS